MKIPRRQYADLYGPTAGDRIRLADTELIVEIEKDLTTPGEEAKFGGGKVIRDGMGQSPSATRSGGALDLVITNAVILDHWGIVKADIGIRHGRIAAIGKAGNPDLMDGVTPGMEVGASTEVLSAEGKIVTAGGMDTHIHFICPQIITEGLANGLTSLIGGGTGPATGTNATTCTPGAWNIHRMLEAADGFPINLGFLGKGNSSLPEGLNEQIEAGAIGLKAFMCPSGIESFPHVDAATLREGMKRAAKLGLLVAVHAEDGDLAEKLAAGQKAKGRTDARAYLASRPVEVELAAIRIALELAGETGCALHVVHVSSPEGIALIEEARAQRVDATAETCPHYLLLNEKDVIRLGAIAKCAPPLRDEKRRVALWDDLRAGRIQTVGSDHSPARPEMKDTANLFAAWGGIAGCQHGFQLLFSECAATAAKDLPRLAAVLARNVARRFRLEAHKGLIAEGRDADFSLIEFGEPQAIQADDLWTRHRISAYVGQRSRARVTHTYVRGAAVYADGRLLNLPPPGRFLRPAI